MQIAKAKTYNIKYYAYITKNSIQKEIQNLKNTNINDRNIYYCKPAHHQA
jgi:hypothetical protein